MTSNSMPPLSVWHAFANTRGLRPKSVRPNHLAAPWDGACGEEYFGISTDLLPPWHDGRAEIIPFRHLQVMLGG